MNDYQMMFAFIVLQIRSYTQCSAHLKYPILFCYSCLEYAQESIKQFYWKSIILYVIEFIRCIQKFLLTLYVSLPKGKPFLNQMKIHPLKPWSRTQLLLLAQRSSTMMCLVRTSCHQMQVSVWLWASSVQISNVITHRKILTWELLNISNNSSR